MSLSLTVCTAAKDNKVQTSAMHCVINGKLNRDTKATMAYLMCIDGRKLVATDSAAVKDGKFVLVTDVGVPVERAISFKGMEKVTPVTVFLDADALTLEQDKDNGEFIVKGSDTNEAFGRLKRTIAPMEKAMVAAIVRYKDTSRSEEDRTKAEKDYNEAEAKMTEVMLECLKENAGNILGFTLLSECYYNMEGAMVEHYLKQIPETFRNPISGWCAMWKMTRNAWSAPTTMTWNSRRQAAKRKNCPNTSRKVN